MLRFLLLLAAATPLFAQNQPARVVLFAEPNYRGETLVVEAGADLTNLARVRDSRGQSWNDRVASVRVEGGVVLVAYENSDFRGAQTTITRNSADLATLSLGDRSGSDWSRRISSLRAEPVQPGRVVMAWNRRDAERAVRSAYRDILGRDPDDSGLRNYRDRLMDEGWTEDRLRDELRRSSEFKQRDVEGLVRKIFREVLGREPDPSGLATYTRRVRDGMSEAELRADLKRSQEYSELAAKEAVIRAYRDILRREPDPSGLENYSKLIRERGWDEKRVREVLRNSDEYRNLPKR